MNEKFPSDGYGEGERRPLTDEEVGSRIFDMELGVQNDKFAKQVESQLTDPEAALKQIKEQVRQLPPENPNPDEQI